MVLLDMDKKSSIDQQGNLIVDSSQAKRSEPKGKRRGPPNRMNDLSYKDWMKFQKSFFRFSTDQAFIEECIYFFTKAVWDDGSASRALIIGAETFSKALIPTPRSVTHIHGHKSCDEVSKSVCEQTRKVGAHDFLLVDLRGLITRQTELDDFITTEANSFFDSLRSSLQENRYCCVVVGLPQSGGGGFPFPWAVALAARAHLCLRDEKMALVENDERVFYCLFMQAKEDGRPQELVTTKDICLASANVHRHAPAWTIPKPPPRRKNEILHPAKFPETLVEQFIHIYSSEGDNVFDPMVGTGSTVIAALRTNRNGFGIDLSPEFVRTAQDRIKGEQAQTATLFSSDEAEGRVFVGDATRLDDIHQLDGIEFQYAITSPPYWSMLSNPGSENQRARRERDLPLVYSDDSQDLGNIADYDEFLDTLEKVYNSVAMRLPAESMLTTVVKNIKRDRILYPLAWDLTLRLCGPKGLFNYAGTTLWCQDDVGLKPFAIGIHWVSNILHTYCLHFRKRRSAS